MEKFSKEKSEEEIKKTPFGYMNLNKRGGFGSTDSKQLKNYVNKYQYFIKRQIELHDPQIVVFCGCFDGIADQLFNIESKWNGNFVYGNIGDKNVRLYYVYHPSCSRFKNSFEYLTNSDFAVWNSASGTSREAPVFPGTLSRKS